jgi:trigger factor
MLNQIGHRLHGLACPKADIQPGLVNLYHIPIWIFSPAVPRSFGLSPQLSWYHISRCSQLSRTSLQYIQASLDLMKVTQEQLEHSQVGLQVEVAADQVKDYYEKAIGGLVKNASIPGFRKGKAPRQIILQRFGSQQIKGMAIESILEKTLPLAVESAEVPAIGNYKILSNFEEMLAEFQSDKAFVYKASVDVLPQVTVGDYSTLSVTAEEDAMPADAVSQFLAERQREKSSLVPVSDRPAQLDDVAVADYSGKLADGTEITGAQATDAELELSPDRFIADLVDGIIGMKIDETKEIPVTFPGDYGRTDLAGQAASFTVTLKDLKVKELPTLDDDFAKEISEQETMAELETTLLERFTKQAEDRTKSNVEMALADSLVEITAADLPETLIDQESTQILQMMANQFSQYGMDVNKLFTRESIPKMKENCRVDAIKNLKKNFAMLEIAKQEKIVVDEVDIDARCLTIRQQLQEEVDEERLRGYVIEDLTKEKVMEVLRGKATITLVPLGSLAKPEADETEEAVEAEA